MHSLPNLVGVLIIDMEYIFIFHKSVTNNLLSLCEQEWLKTFQDDIKNEMEKQHFC